LPTVLVVDDHPAFRLGIVSLIQRVGELQVCAEAEDGEQALAEFRKHGPNLVVMDICLPDADGIELARQMRKEASNVGILMLSLHEEPLYAARALRAGARGYLRKDEGLPELALALRRIARDRYYLSKHFRGHLLLEALQGNGNEPDSVLDRLSPREIEVFRQLGRGLGGAAIASVLNLGVKTVETHRANIKKKLNLANAGETTRLAMEWHAMETEPEAVRHEPAAGFSLRVNGMEESRRDSREVGAAFSMLG
jgi:DNA-binding NarL/FixJ family response regulator